MSRKTSRLHIRRYLLAGAVALLPLVLTVILVRILFRFILGMTSPLLRPLASLWSYQAAPWLVDLASLLLTLFLIWLFGFLVTHFFGSAILRAIEALVARIPFVANLYRALKQLTEMFLGEGGKKFRRVVLVQWPRKDIYTFGFVTSEAAGEVQEKTKGDVFHVFIPTTPNPTSGFLVLMTREQMIALDMTPDEAIKYVISGGLTPPSEWKKKK
ncbi:MAG: DUF502 domain-containing protein [Elusimicrobia bacterium]|nr:DUF502 domain-containing protein [Elusimicrobiota bacterium]